MTDYRFWTLYAFAMVAFVLAVPPILHYYDRWFSWWLR